MAPDTSKQSFGNNHSSAFLKKFLLQYIPLVLLTGLIIFSIAFHERKSFVNQLQEREKISLNSTKKKFETQFSTQIGDISMLAEMTVRLWAKNSDCRIFMVNQQGYWLIGPDEKDEWGFVFEQNASKTMANRFPEEWEDISTHESGQMVSATGLFTFVTITPASESSQNLDDAFSVHTRDRWKLISLVESDHLTPSWWPSVLWGAGLLQPLLLVLIFSWSKIQFMKQRAEDELQGYRTHLEELVESRTEELQKQTNQLKKLSRAIEQSPESIVITDKEGTIEYVNPAFTDKTGYSYDEAIGQNPRILKSEKNSPAIYENMWEVLTSGKIWKGELINKRKEGREIWEIVSIAPVLNERGETTHYVAVKEDISSLKQIEAELIRTKEIAEAANQAKSEFLANMSHEIRTPMNAVLGYADILKRMERHEKKSQYIESIRTAGDSLLCLIDDILDLARIESGKMELQFTSCSIQSLFGDLNDLFSQRILDKGLSFSVEIDENIPPNLILDAARLRQVFINLIGNAVKFTHDGFIKVKAVCRFSEDALQNRIDLSFSVSDSGIGIPGELHEKIFNSFEQVNGQKGTAYEGTGLGLAICKRIIELMEGRIHVKSKLGEGTTFTLLIPGIEISSEPGIIRGKETADPSAVRFASASILIVDDIDYNREILSTYLGNSGLTIHTADNGKQAIEKTREIKPDLILLDMKMPVMDGYEASEKLKKSSDTHQIPIIAVTALALKQDEDKVRKNCDDYLSKPISKAKLINKLKNFLPHESISRVVKTQKNAPQQDEETKMILPPVEALEKLNQLAMGGFISEIEQFAADLKKMEKKYSPFADHLEKMAARFDDEQITVFAAQCLEKIRN